jgi:hypothetical protein
MSYTKDTANGTLVFHYYTDDLFDRVNALSLYKGRAIKGDGGISQIDDVALTEGERDAFNIFMPTAATKVFSLVMRMTNSVLNALVINDVVDFGDASDSDQTLQYAVVVEDNDAYNDNILQQVDRGIQDMLTFHCLADWYELMNLDEQAAKMLAKYNDMRLEMVNKRLFDLRKPLMSL